MLGCLGEGTYDVRFVRRATATNPRVTLGEAQALSGSWERLLAETSSATAVFALAGEQASSACVSLLAQLLPWYDEMELWRDSLLVWAGPVLNVVADPEAATATVTASDLSAWWEKRVLPTIVSRQLDLATIFDRYIAAAFAADDPGIVVVTTPTGIVGDRTVDAADGKLLANELDELAKTGVDWTVANRVFYVGGTEVAATTPRLPTLLTDELFRIAPQTRRSGDGWVNDAYVYADKLVGHYGGAEADGVLLQGVQTEQSIEDQGSADAAARTWWDRAHEPLVYLEGDNALDPSAPLTVDQLVAGVLARLDVSGGGVVPLTTELRVESVSAEFDATSETITLGLQPVGTTEDE